MRITFAIPTLCCGGAERNLLLLVSAMQTRGHECRVVVLDTDKKDVFYQPEAAIEVSLEPRCPVTRFPQLFWRRREKLDTLRRRLLENSPDIVVCFLTKANISVLQALKNSGVPVVVSERNNLLRQRRTPYWEHWRDQVYPTAARIVVLAEDLVPWIERNRPLWPVVGIPNPFVPAAYPSDTMPVEAAGIFEHPTVIAMGRLERVKGFDRLLPAFAMASKGLPRWDLIVLGEGTQRRTLERQAARLGLADRCHFPGNVPNPKPWLHCGQLFAFSSRYEGFGMALLEAMACGLPAVSMDCPFGPKRIIHHGIDGLLVPESNRSGLADALRRLMSDEALRERLGHAAPKVVERFAPEVIFDRWESVLREAVAQ